MNESFPPKWALQFLRAICPDHLYEEIEGDLIQKFQRDVKAFGELKAQRRFLWNTIRFFRPGIVLRNKFSNTNNPMDMFRSDLKIAWRHLLKETSFSIINILGLSTSIAACLLIFQYSAFELGYDSFHKNADRIFRITTKSYTDNEVRSASALSSHLAGPGLKDNFPEVEQHTQLLSTRSWFDCTLMYKSGDHQAIFNERNLYFTSKTFFTGFSFPLVRGDAATALEKPYSAVLSESVAKRYFGDEDPLGKVLYLKGSFDQNNYTVTGVMRSFPEDTHLDADILLSLSSLENNTYLKNDDLYTYILLSQGADINTLAAKLPGLVSQFTGKPGDDPDRTELNIQPLKDIHLYSNFQDEIKPGGNARAVFFLMIAAFSILVIAWINYVNMTTAHSVERAKEVGIRKVSGASRLQLTKQFLTESVLINVLSIFIAAGMIVAATPYFFRITGFSFSFTNLFDLTFNYSVFIAVSIFCTGIFLSGVYPASIISSFHPARVLKSRFIATKSGLTLKRILVISQFTCAISLMVGVFVLHNQFDFMQKQDLGIDINKTVVIKAPVNVDTLYLTRLANFKKELQSLSLAGEIASSTAVPGEKIEWTGNVRREQDKSKTGSEFIVHVVDTDFINTFKLSLLAGRNFEFSDFPGDKFGAKTENVILNTKAVRQLGFDNPDESLGTYIYWGENKCKIVGVIDNFHQRSLKNALQPTLFTANLGPNLSLKLGKGVNNENLLSSVAIIREKWNLFFPDSPFDYFFLEDYYNAQYQTDILIRNLFSFFSGLSILISCLGLFGLSSYTVKRREKEMSIRKVLGAPLMALLVLLSREFLLLTTTACLVALPISYFGLERWLEGFAYHINLSGWLFAVPVFLILLITLVTIGAQTLKTAQANPVDALKNE